MSNHIVGIGLWQTVIKVFLHILIFSHVQIYKLLVTLCKPFPYLRNLNLTEVDEKESAVWEKDQPELVGYSHSEVPFQRSTYCLVSSDDIQVVTTPLKMQVMLKMRPTFCASVRHVVIDEADLLLSFGYESEMRSVFFCSALILASQSHCFVKLNAF